MKRCLSVLLLAVAVTGCGSKAAPPPSKPALPVAEHIRVVPKRTFVRRVDRICDDLNRLDIGTPPAISSDVLTNRRNFGAWFGHGRTIVRRARHRFVELGLPAGDRARWKRVLSKIRAVESHLDTMRAAAWSGSADMLVLSARELMSTSKSLELRFRRFGAKRCV